MAQPPVVAVVDDYREQDGIYLAASPVQHREAEYRSQALDIVRDMQQRHFWYRGRHRFLLHAVKRFTVERRKLPQRVIDLGGGCGGWLSYLSDAGSFNITELGLADSSTSSLRIARGYLPSAVKLFHADLLDLRWRNRWDVAFLMDVLEHIPADIAALRQIYQALTPGGLLFVTVPALPAFWSWNDELVGHQRRYTAPDFRNLAEQSGLEILDARYFMFYLSPLLIASRMAQSRKVTHLSEAERWQLAEKMHQVPAPPINALLGAIFSAETPVGHWASFPWGASLLAVLRKPASNQFFCSADR